MDTDLQTSSIRFIYIDSEDPELLAPNINQWPMNLNPRKWCPATDLIEMADRLVIRLEIAGMHPADFSIRIEPKRVKILGSRSESHEERCYHRMEIPFGDFESEVDLPQIIDVQHAVAEYRDGFLTLTLPKVEQKQPQDGKTTRE